MRRLAIGRRYSLATMAEGWTDDCYLTYLPATFADVNTLQQVKVEGMTDAEGAEEIVKFVRDHVTGGLGLVLDDEGNQALEPLTPGDVELLPPDTLQDLFAKITGAQLGDPKVTQPVAVSAEKQPEIGKPTATS